jgi:hypothetical protein
MEGKGLACIRQLTNPETQSDFVYSMCLLVLLFLPGMPFLLSATMPLLASLSTAQ